MYTALEIDCSAPETLTNALRRACEERGPAPVAARPANAAAAESPGAMTAREATLTPPIYDAELSAAWVRSGRVVGYRCVGVCADGLVLEGPAALQVNTVIHLRLFGEHPMEAFVHVVQCQPAGDGFCAEARMIALTGSQRRRWDEIVARVAEAEAELDADDIPVEVDRAPSAPPPPRSSAAGGTALTAKAVDGRWLALRWAMLVSAMTIAIVALL